VGSARVNLEFTGLDPNLFDSLLRELELESQFKRPYDLADISLQVAVIHE
jgi:hypothetical protein